MPPRRKATRHIGSRSCPGGLGRCHARTVRQGRGVIRCRSTAWLTITRQTQEAAPSRCAATHSQLTRGTILGIGSVPRNAGICEDRPRIGAAAWILRPDPHWLAHAHRESAVLEEVDHVQQVQIAATLSFLARMTLSNTGHSPSIRVRSMVRLRPAASTKFAHGNWPKTGASSVHWRREDWSSRTTLGHQMRFIVEVRIEGEDRAARLFPLG